MSQSTAPTVNGLIAASRFLNAYEKESAKAGPDVDAPELSLLANAGVALQVTTADPNARPTKTRRRIAINRSPRMHALRLERYIFKLAKQITSRSLGLGQDLGISLSARAMAVMVDLTHDLLDRITTEASFLACNAKKSTIAAREIATAARLVLGGELAKHALTEGDKALAKYNKAVRGEA